MKGYTAIITGGNKGIGADLAQAMLAKGWHVVSLARHPGADAGVEHVICDLSDPAAVEDAARAIAARHQVTHFVQNAGIILPNLIEDARAQDMLALTQLHLASALTLTQAFLPAMKARVTSCTVPRRPTGMRRARSSSCALPFGTMPQKLSVRIGPGATTLTVMPCSASSSAHVRAMPIIPALDAE